MKNTFVLLINIFVVKIDLNSAFTKEIFHKYFKFGYTIYLCFLIFRTIWKRHVKPTTLSCPTTHIAMAIGVNTPTMRKGKGTRKSAKRYVIFSRYIPCNALYTHIIILQSLQLGMVAANYYNCSEYKIRYCKCICSLLSICYLSCNCVILHYLIYLVKYVKIVKITPKRVSAR